MTTWRPMPGETQPLLFDTGEPIRRVPTEEEVAEAILWAAKLAVNKHHRGRPPHGMSWEDLISSVQLGALERIRSADYRHGGKYTLREFSYLAADQALRDLQREEMRRWNTGVQPDWPLLDQLEAS